MNLRELEVQAKALAPIIKGVIDKAISTLREALTNDLNDRDVRLREDFSKALQPTEVDLEEVARAAAALIPVPENGKDADPDVLRAAVSDAVAALPVPKDGTSVTMDDVAPFIAEAISEAISAIPAPEPGKSVTPEDLRPLIAEEVAKAMHAVQLPSNGEPGRDALQLEILPEIESEKSYSRGTYARHRGGLWRSFERTHGMKGWECIVDGVDSLAIDQSGDRGFQVELTMSSGGQVCKSLDLPIMIYRGVFSPGDYLPGDTVTWAGSLWHCDQPTSDKPGEQGSKGWRLAVKRGRDGKDGVDGKDLTKGVTIR